MNEKTRQEIYERAERARRNLALVDKYVGTPVSNSAVDSTRDDLLEIMEMVDPVGQKR